MGGKGLIVDGRSWIHTIYNNKGHGHQHVLFFSTSKVVGLSESKNAYRQVTYLCPQNSRNLILIVQNSKEVSLLCSERKEKEKTANIRVMLGIINDA